MPTKGDILTLAIATGDTPSRLCDDPRIVFRDVNIHIYGSNVYYGGGDAVAQAVQGAVVPGCSMAAAAQIITYQDLTPSTLWFKNFTLATNAVVVATGTLAVTV